MILDWPSNRPSHQGLGSYDIGVAEFACVYRKELFPHAPRRINIGKLTGMESNRHERSWPPLEAC